MFKYFSRYLITTAKHAVKIEPSKYLGKYMPTHVYVEFFHVQKNQYICDKITFFYFT